MHQTIGPFPIGHIHNPNAAPGIPYGPALEAILNAEGFESARREISGWPGYAPTPLHRLSGLAGAAGVAEIWYKDEGGRFGLGSFKALGGAYAVSRVLAREVAARRGQGPVSAADLRAGRHRDLVAGLTVCAATDGNHGRSVSWGARLFGSRCVIYIPDTVSPGRQRAMERYGAEVRRIDGTFDDAVRKVDQDAAAQGWIVVADTTYPGYTEIPRHVMHGYGVMAAEAIAASTRRGGAEPRLGPGRRRRAGGGGLRPAVAALRRRPPALCGGRAGGGGLLLRQRPGRAAGGGHGQFGDGHGRARRRRMLDAGLGAAVGRGR